MKKWLQKGVLFSMVICLCLSLCSCGGSKSLLSYSLSDDPDNLDPQTATDYNALEVISNIYEGLFTKDAHGNATLGAAESYQVSEDGKTYTFQIRKGVRWKYYDKENRYKDEPLLSEVTANDFVFAFQRLLDPSTSSPYAKDFYCIHNAQKVHSGSIDKSALGIQANGDDSLTFQLDYPTPLFPELLMSAAASPCNQAFFEKTMGQYGLSKSALLCNGPFYVNEWSKTGSSHYVRIRTNDFYPKAKEMGISGVNFTVRSESEAAQALKKNDIDMATVSSLTQDSFSASRYQISDFSNTVYGLSFQMNDPVFANANLRKALSSDIDRNACQGVLTADQKTAQSVVPSAVTVLDQNYRQDVGEDIALPYSPNQAKQWLQSGLKATHKTDLNSMVMLVPQESEKMAQMILQIWQRDLGVFMQMDTEPQDSYQKKLESGNYSVAFMPVSSKADTPGSILSCFVSGNSSNFGHYQSAAYDRLYSEAALQGSVSAMEQKYLETEKYLLQDACFAPVYFQNQHFIVNKNVQKVVFDPASKLIRFQYASKK